MRKHRSDVISWPFVVPRPHTLFPDHSFHYIHATSNKRNGHKSSCSKLISGTKALQFVTFWKFLYLTENAGEHRSKGTDHIYGVHYLWSEWSKTKIFHSRTFLKKWGIIDLMSYLGCLWSLDHTHTHTNFRPLISWEMQRALIKTVTNCAALNRFGAPKRFNLWLSENVCLSQRMQESIDPKT